MPNLPEECFLEHSNEIAYRNMLLFRLSDKNIHFEFPMFEDHSYNSICNGKGVKNLFRRPVDNEKYIIFRTHNFETQRCNIIGYYKIGRLYYQETRLFNDNGFVLGIETEKTHLIKKGLEFNDLNLRQGIRVSWNDERWETILHNLLERIESEEDFSDKYNSDTNRLIRIFQNEVDIRDWRESCQACTLKNKCSFHRRNRLFKRNFPDTDLFSVIYNIYTSNIYSRNYLNSIEKIYVR
jgi:hypothetical protein